MIQRGQQVIRRQFRRRLLERFPIGDVAPGFVDLDQRVAFRCCAVVRQLAQGLGDDRAVVRNFVTQAFAQRENLAVFLGIGQVLDQRNVGAFIRQCVTLPGAQRRRRRRHRRVDFRVVDAAAEHRADGECKAHQHEQEQRGDQRKGLQFVGALGLAQLGPQVEGIFIALKQCGGLAHDRRLSAG